MLSKFNVLLSKFLDKHLPFNQQKVPPMSIPFIDLKAQQALMRPEIDAAMAAVLDSGQYINGQALHAFEQELSDFSGAKHALGVSSGTDALVVPLMAWGVGAGDAVFVPSFTYTASAEAILIVGASPVYVEVDPRTFNIDPEDLKIKIAEVKAEGRLTPKVVMSVDLFGLPIDYTEVSQIARENDMKLLSDAAQGFGGEYNGQKVGSLADATATSFFPAKPLGCYGDGGAVFTNDSDFALTLKSVRTHGMGKHKYDIERVGLNARLDTLQAAILSVKLKYFPGELDARNALARSYNDALADVVDVPVVANNKRSAWAQYTIKLEDDAQRTAFQAHLKDKGVPTMVYYPSPMHFQTPYAPYGGGKGSMPVSESLCHKVVAIPMHPYMSDQTCDEVISACTSFFTK